MDFLKKMLRDGSKTDSRRCLESPNEDQARPRHSQLPALDALAKASSPASAPNSESTTRKKRLITWPSEPEPVEYVVDKSAKKIYSKGKLLGKGAFAKCYEVTDIESREKLAVKVIDQAKLTTAKRKDRLSREIEIQSRLSHPNILQIRGHFDDSDNNSYIILELCSNQSLSDVLEARNQLTEPEVRYYMRQVIAGCRYMHDRGVIHRDLKLANLLLDHKMCVKIADFGLAAVVLSDDEKKMTVCGTPNYVAPEVLDKKGHSFEVDIWAIGCMMYALLTGKPPFETRSLKETYRRIMSTSYTIPAWLSSRARNLIRRILSSEPSARPSLALILADEFFTSSYTPKKLSSESVRKKPKFAESSKDVIEKNKNSSKKIASQNCLAAEPQDNHATAAATVQDDHRQYQPSDVVGNVEQPLKKEPYKKSIDSLLSSNNAVPAPISAIPRRLQECRPLSYPNLAPSAATLEKENIIDVEKYKIKAEQRSPLTPSVPKNDFANGRDADKKDRSKSILKFIFYPSKLHSKAFDDHEKKSLPRPQSMALLEDREIKSEDYESTNKGMRRCVSEDFNALNILVPPSDGNVASIFYQRDDTPQRESTTPEVTPPPRFLSGDIAGKSSPICDLGLDVQVVMPEQASLMPSNIITTQRKIPEAIEIPGIQPFNNEFSPTRIIKSPQPSPKLAQQTRITTLKQEEEKRYSGLFVEPSLAENRYTDIKKIKSIMESDKAKKKSRTNLGLFAKNAANASQRMDSLFVQGSDEKEPAPIIASASKVTLPSETTQLQKLLEKNISQMTESRTATRILGDEAASLTFVSKWVDYSLKFGFGYALSNGTTGVVFRDGSRMFNSTSSSKKVMYAEAKKSYKPRAVLMKKDRDVRHKATLLRHFARYMDNNLVHAADVIPSLKTSAVNDFHLCDWRRTEEAILMFLQDGSAQVNFHADHTKLVLGNILHTGSEGDCLVMFINSVRQSSTYRLSHLREQGCPPVLLAKLRQANHLLNEILISNLK